MDTILSRSIGRLMGRRSSSAETPFGRGTIVLYPPSLLINHRLYVAIKGAVDELDHPEVIERGYR